MCAMIWVMAQEYMTPARDEDAEIRASIDAWMELAEPVLAELEAAQRLTSKDLRLVINY